jgi:hypothetical protein
MERRVIPHRSGFIARVLMHSTIAVAVSGCAQGSSTPSYLGTPQKLAGPATQHFYGDWMYSSQPSSNQVVVYKRQRNGFMLTPYETLTGFKAPMGMVATPDGHWYIANSGGSNIPVYRSTISGPQKTKTTLTDNGQVPVNVDATPNRLLVAVSNGSTTGGSAGSVSVYVNGQTQPSRVLTYGNDPIQGEGIAIDSSGNCYWSFNDPRTLTGSIVEFAGCNGSGTLFHPGILKAGGLAFDHSGNLYYVDQLAGIFECQGPSSCSPFLLNALDGLVIPSNINFDNGSPQNLWVADAVGHIDAVSLNGVIGYILDVIGGLTDPPIGIAPAPGS